MAYVEVLDRADKTGTYYRCPQCGRGTVRVDNSVFYGRCDVCRATLINYTPEPHQEAFHKSTITYSMLIGGFASGKTTAACAEDALHVMQTPYSTLLITAPTLQQVREAVLPELEKFLPPWFLVGGRVKGNPPVYRLINGSKILIYSSDNETKIRSLNLTGFHIEEASGVNFEVFKTLQTRLRNRAAVIYDEDGKEAGNKFMGILSTNPEEGWVRDQFLLRSRHIHGSETVDTDVYKQLRVPEELQEKSYQTFISTSFDNSHLPEGTIDRISAGRDERWKRKYLYSVLEGREGLVYKDLLHNFEEPFDIPDHWERLVGFDPGISHPTAALICAVDPSTHVIHCYDEYYKTDLAVSQHGKVLTPMIKPYKLMYPIQADPAVRKRSTQTGHTYKGYFKTVTGLILKEANNDILYGIEKVKDYIYAKRIMFFNSLLYFKKESQMYRFPEIKSTGRKDSDVPIDKDNHLMDCMRYLVSPLPRNPIDFKGTYVQKDLLKVRSVFKDKHDSSSQDGKYNKTHVRRWGDSYG
jgi:PBSX family phage terminase large subunit